MSPMQCPVCDTTNELSPTELAQCKSCGFPLIENLNNTDFFSTLRHDIPKWSRRLWNDLKEKDKQIEDLRTELAQLKENLGQRSQAEQQDDSVTEESEAEIHRENIDDSDFWKQVDTHVNRIIENSINSLVENFKNQLQDMREKIDKDIETRFKEQNPRYSPDQTLSDHDSSGSETSSETLSSTGQDGMDMNRNTSSSVTSSSGDSQSHSWSCLSERKPDNATVVSPDNIGEMRSIITSTSSNEVQYIVEQYNNNTRQLKKNYTSVSSPDINERLRSGQSVPMMSFTPDKNGTYWLLQSKTNSLSYLVPKEKLPISEPTYNLLIHIFKCDNYNPAYAKKYRLIEPAQVQQIYPNQWQLVGLGHIVFG